MATYLTISGVDLKEASGESFSTVVKAGTLTVSGDPPAIAVDGTRVPLVASAREPFARIGRDFKLATDDVMGFTYISLPAGLEDRVYDRFEAILAALAAGKPLPAPEPAAPAAAAAAAAATAGAAGASAAAPAEGAAKPGFFDQLKELGAKAKADTLAVASAIKAKAEHDIHALQEQAKAAQAAQQQPQGGAA